MHTKADPSSSFRLRPIKLPSSNRTKLEKAVTAYLNSILSIHLANNISRGKAGKAGKEQSGLLERLTSACASNTFNNNRQASPRGCSQRERHHVL